MIAEITPHFTNNSNCNKQSIHCDAQKRIVCAIRSNDDGQQLSILVYCTQQTDATRFAIQGIYIKTAVHQKQHKIAMYANHSRFMPACIYL